MMDTYNSFQFIAFDIFKFQNDQCFDELLCSIGENGVIKRSSNKRLKLPFQKTKSKAYPMWDLILGIAFPII